MTIENAKAFLASPMAPKLLGVAARGVGYALATAGVLIPQNDLVEILSSLLGMAVLIWSCYEKIHSQQKFNAAAASQEPITEKQAERIVAAGAAPSVLTPKTEVPVVGLDVSKLPSVP